MNVPLAVPPHPAPAPAFTLTTALRWLGHQCPSRCSASADDLHATVWFMRRRDTSWPTPHEALVVVDLTDRRDSVANIRRRIRDIAACTRADGILVRERRADNDVRALASVTRGTEPPSYFRSLASEGDQPWL